MKQAIDIKTLDRRIAERMIRIGEITQEQWDKHLESLPDDADKAATIETELETGVIETEG